MAKKKSVTENTTTGAPVPTRRRASSAKTAAAATDTAAATPAANGRQPSQAEIAEAAYFRHLNRGGGTSGDEFNDWVEAERELKERYSR
jgi:hypothetical protein